MGKNLFGINDEKLFYGEAVFKLDVETKDEDVVYHTYFYDIAAPVLGNTIAFINSHMAGVICVKVIKEPYK